MTFGALLKHYREARHLSLRELGTLSGVDHGYLSCLERGQKDHPSSVLLRALSTSLKLDRRQSSLLRSLAMRTPGAYDALLRVACLARRVLSHWDEFGHDNDLDHAMEELRKALALHADEPQIPVEKGA